MTTIDRETKLAKVIADAVITTLRKFGQFHSETMNSEITKTVHQSAFVGFRDFYTDEEKELAKPK